ncbi:MAG: hypothetical protein AAF416_20540 [Pseudomonadota bacterium]
MMPADDAGPTRVRGRGRALGRAIARLERRIEGTDLTVGDVTDALAGTAMICGLVVDLGVLPI